MTEDTKKEKANKAGDFTVLINEVENLSIDEWKIKHPFFYEWLMENGFRYIPELDKNKDKQD